MPGRHPRYLSGKCSRAHAGPAKIPESGLKPCPNHGQSAPMLQPNPMWGRDSGGRAGLLTNPDNKKLVQTL